MKIYKAVFFWFGGVLTETLPVQTVAEFMPEAEGHQALKARQQLRGAAESLVLGKIAPSDYCAEVVKVCGLNLTAADVERRLLDSAPLDQAMADLIASIPGTYERWLVVDYPADWYQTLSKRWNLGAMFSEDRLIFLSEMKLVTLVPDIFYRIPQAVGHDIDDCIVIDANAGRAVKAMKHGLATIIYVYPGRLKLELALQGIWQTEADVMHPTSSQRVEV